jgi:dsDNA-binding SOS-regulon protein
MFLLSYSILFIILRYIDDIFFTSNESLDRINKMLDDANNLHPNIKLVRQLGTSVSFLDVFIENKNGVLTTSLHHKEAAEPYIVPFKSDHPRHIFKNVIDVALMRAVRYSSTRTAFNEEQRSIKLMFLYNG